MLLFLAFAIITPIVPEIKDTKKVKQFEGSVEEALPAGMFRIRLKDERLVIGYLAGKMRLYHIKIIPGDRVLIDFSQYDETRGRIVRRL